MIGSFKIIILTAAFLLFLGCKRDSNRNKEKAFLPQGKEIPIKYASGFSITRYEDYRIVTVKNPWPDAEITYRYLLLERGKDIPQEITYDELISIPVEEIVVTSTTHISALEILGEAKSLTGFPGLDYISSPLTRKRIEAGKIRELGENQALNTEVLLALRPDVVIGFAVDGKNKALGLIKKNDIPVVFNSDWMEASPLGKAEWIKFFGAFFNKTEEAAAFFEKVEKAYHNAREMAASAEKCPTVIAGAMNRGVWFCPAGESWHAEFFRDANARYLFGNTEGKGSLSLSFETVFATAKDADYWIGPAEFQSYSQLKNASPHYAEFKAFRKRNIYTYSSERGATGGVIFYELAPLRPDLVLKDLISIFHPELFPQYNPRFYKPLK